MLFLIVLGVVQNTSSEQPSGGHLEPLWGLRCLGEHSGWFGHLPGRIPARVGLLVYVSVFLGAPVLQTSGGPGCSCVVRGDCPGAAGGSWGSGVLAVGGSWWFLAYLPSVLLAVPGVCSVLLVAFVCLLLSLGCSLYI